MPICPRCSATIHAGAEDQCPACGYSLVRANAIFGEENVEFTRVLDGAGALTHQERMELLHALEEMERLIPPVALCIFITDNGQVQDLRTQAHWMLNHAHIHHPSFGKREQRKAIEDAELRERRPGEERPHYADVSPGLFERLWNSITAYVRDAMHPYPPPARQEWMLMLVVDVQLEMACFSWGYKLDPYVNPDSINSCIMGARLQFRERAMVAGLRKVMKAAVHQLAASAHRNNRRLRRMSALPKGIRALLLGAALLGLSLPPADAAPQKPSARPAAKQSAKPAAKPTAKPAAKSSVKPAAKPTAKPAPKPTTKPTPKPAPKQTPPPAPKAEAPAAPAPALADDDVAEEVEDIAEEVTPAPAAETPQPTPADGAAAETTAAPAPLPEAPAEKAEDKGASASYSAAPRWQGEHYRLLMTGELETGYNALFPPQTAAAPAVSPTPTAKAAVVKTEESDTQVPGRYCDAYLHPDGNQCLCDPQKLLSTAESNDVAHVLREINANARYRICTAVFLGSQEIPAEMHASTLAGTYAQPVSEYAAVLVYPLGRPDAIDIGYREIKVDDTKRHEWLIAVREAAAEAGGGAPGLMAALRKLNSLILPLSAGFRALTPEDAEKAPHIPVELRPKEDEKGPSMKEKMREALSNPENIPTIIASVIVFLVLGSVPFWFFWLRRHSATLLDTPADLRLASPYGAGVSRYVRYLEGRESEKEKSLF
ncbi:MAG: hypothetical protein MJ051_02390 [Akkermansia sp.]|nr:hypothetical protein [Akkermansia sp.]